MPLQLQNSFQVTASFRKQLAVLAELTKLRITFFVSITTLFGFVSAKGYFTVDALFSCLGIFLMACSSAVLNQIQEHEIDSVMERTKSRPIPSGQVSVKSAVLLVIELFFLAVLVFSLTNWTTFWLGVVTFVWYNLIYTPLKKKHYLAIIPGSVIGALPPMAGWAAAGRNILEPQILLIAFFFFVWQIPHFWLLLLQYRKDYESAGFPTMFKRFTREQLSRITFAGILFTGFIGVSFPIFAFVHAWYLIAIILFAFIYMVVQSLSLLDKSLKVKSFKPVFIGVNLYVLFVIVIISIDRFILP